MIDAYSVDAPPFLSKAQRDQVGDWYRSKVITNPDYNKAVSGAAKSFVVQRHDLDFNITKEQATAAAERWIVAVADTFAPLSGLTTTTASPIS